MILETAMRSALAARFITEMDTGAADAKGQFETSGDVEVATINFQATSFTESGGVCTLAGVPLSSPAATGGTTAQFSLYDADSTKQAELTVGTSGTEITITSTTIAASEIVDLTSLTITVPAGP